MSRTRRARLAVVLLVAWVVVLPGCMGPGEKATSPGSGKGEPKAGKGAAQGDKVAGRVKEPAKRSAGQSQKVLAAAKGMELSKGTSPNGEQRRAERPEVKVAGMGSAAGLNVQLTAADTAFSAAVLGDLLLSPEPYYYETAGRRDLFESLISEGFRDANPDPKMVSRELQVVGILWGENDRFALLESGEGKSLILREGDALGDGTVARILPDRVIVHITEYGTSRTRILPVVQGGETDESPRSRGR